ncbi:MAG: DUF3786 domain-containing protein [Candidatus Omnitrophota bacterium]
MGYEVSIEKAWEELSDREGKVSVGFLNDEYEVDFESKEVLSLSCNIPAKDYYKILILHYLAKEENVLSIEQDDWASFKEMEGGGAYYTAFRKRAIEPILRKYGDDPLAIYERMKDLNASKLDIGTAGLSIKVFEKIRVGVVLWAKDEEFSAECNMFFNRSIKCILPTEDIAVLGGIVVSKI